MKLLRAVSCWGNEALPYEALALAEVWEFEAVEGPMPIDARAFGGAVRNEGKVVFAEIATGCESGCYVPSGHARPAEHLEDFRRKLESALEADPLRITVLGGSDLWDFGTSCSFFEDLVEICEKMGASICIETHRARPTFHPVPTLRLLKELPRLRLTLDVSHWCAVCERLMPRELDLMGRIERCVGHVHARVGYDQGPQVPDPRAPRYQEELAAHLECWQRIARLAEARGEEFLTLTPEFGPDGYLQSDPLTGRPAADLRDLNRWMGEEAAQFLTSV